MSDFLVDTVLIIDDNAIDRFIHRKLITHHKIAREIMESNGGREALSILKRCIEGGNFPNLILLDLMMPEMDGFEFLSYYEKLVQQFPLRPSLFMVSSTEDDKDQQRARNNPHIIKLLHKPLTPQLLVNHLR